jgi:hypothetical protein
MRTALVPVLPIATAILIIAEALSGCTPKGDAVDKETVTIASTNERVQKAVTGALAMETNAELRAWHTFKQRWPSCSQRLGFAWDKQEQQFQGDAVLIAGIRDRYALRLILNLKVGANCQDVKITKLRLHLSEVAQIVPSPGGGFSIGFNTESDRWFGIQELNSLVIANWDFSALGITIISNAPLANFRSVLPRL